MRHGLDEKRSEMHFEPLPFFSSSCFFWLATTVVFIVYELWFQTGVFLLRVVSAVLWSDAKEVSEIHGKWGGSCDPLPVTSCYLTFKNKNLLLFLQFCRSVIQGQSVSTAWYLETQLGWLEQLVMVGMAGILACPGCSFVRTSGTWSGVSGTSGERLLSFSLHTIPPHGYPGLPYSMEVSG